MNPARMLRSARKRAGLDQRSLAAKAGVPPSTVARIETGVIDPRASTLDRLLRECGFQLEVLERMGTGVDRTLIREHLALSPSERVLSLVRAEKQLADAVRVNAQCSGDQDVGPAHMPSDASGESVSDD